MTRTLPITLQAKADFVRETMNGPNLHGVGPLPPGRDPVACDARPECAGCGIASHGFLCHFADGSCLRYDAPAGAEVTRRD